jgi:hypothetical protein
MLDMIEARNSAALVREQIDVEQALIWAYRNQRVGYITRHGIYASQEIHVRPTRSVSTECYPRGFGLDSVVRVQRSAANASTRDQRQQWATEQLAHPDARAIDDAVRRLTYEAQALLMRHGKGGTRPDWDLPPEWEPELGWRDWRRQWGVKDKLDEGLSYTPVRPTQHSLDDIETARQAYLTWHDGMYGLVAALQHAALTRWVVIAPRAPRYPWVTRLDSEL